MCFAQLSCVIICGFSSSLSRNFMSIYETNYGSNFQVESIVLSIISMLSSPNDESPANVEAAVSVVLMFFYFYHIYVITNVEWYLCICFLFCFLRPLSCEIDF